MTPKRCKHGVFNACPDCAAERDRRERIAATLLAGMLANPSPPLMSLFDQADRAIQLSDRLIARLDEGHRS